MAEAAVVVVALHWHDRATELAFVTRALAGAASRSGEVSVLVPGPVGGREPDGAFDLLGIGEPGALTWPASLGPKSVVIADDLTDEVRTGLEAAGCEPGFRLWPRQEGPWRRLGFGEVDGDVLVHGPFVPVDLGATTQRHHGFGFTGYVLVLTDRDGAHTDPPPEVAWLTSAFHDTYIVLVEHAIASAWRGRSLRGTSSVDSRMDLWRLVAHASVCIDLAPGALMARECAEALRLGTPVIVPSATSVAAEHARGCGTEPFVDAWGLLEATDKVRGEAARALASARGKEYADARFGDPEAFVEAVARLRRAPPYSRGRPSPIH